MSEILTNLSREKYEGIEAVNYSILKHFNRSPAHAREEMLHPSEPTKAMEISNADHLAILEPERFKKEYIVAPKVDRRTREGKEQWARFEAENASKSYLTETEFQQCEDIIKSIKKRENIANLLYGRGTNELSFVWEDTETGLLCKGRLDRFTTYYGYSAIIDIKAVRSAVPGIFSNQCAKMNWHIQCAFYKDGLNTIQPIDRERRYIIVAIEKERPYEMRLFEFTDEAEHEGRMKYKSYLKQYKQCLETNVWPGYDDEVEPLALPRGAMGDYEIEMEEFNE